MIYSLTLLHSLAYFCAALGYGAGNKGQTSIVQAGIKRRRHG